MDPGIFARSGFMLTDSAANKSTVLETASSPPYFPQSLYHRKAG
jgi:hypothetical protein